MTFISTKEAAKRLALTPRRVMGLCNEGAFKGAYKNGRSWQIPLEALESYMGKASVTQDTVLPCPVGNTSYIEICEQCYYVDKTLLIKDILDEANKVILFARPRRFGKTLTMDMLRTFFELADKDTSVYFSNRRIWKEGKKYTDHLGKYPVVFLSFKDLKLKTWKSTFTSIKLVLKDEFKRHNAVLQGDILDSDEKETFKRIVEQEVSYEEYIRSLKFLTDVLFKYYGRKAIIIIDEYDTPIQHAYANGFYDETIDFFKNFFSVALKDNTSLERGFLTGILRISKENLFSDLNNITVNTVTDTRYGDYFGFTEAEVNTIAKYYGLEDKLSEIREWYDGYKFGTNEIYNPWSVTSYFSNNCEPNPYWAYTSSIEIVKETLMNADHSVIQDLKDLLLGKEIIVRIDTRIIYPMHKTRKDAIYTFLLLTGYLKIVRRVQDDFYSLALPNKEIRSIYQQEVLSWLIEYAPESGDIGNNICRALFTNNTELLESTISRFLKASASFLDTSSESFYHGLILAFCAAAADRYIIRSNRESGYGRFDIQMEPKDHENPAIIMEFKVADSKDDLKARSREGLEQIKEKEYYTDLSERGFKNIISYGIAFCGKDIDVSSK